jgi:RimJ/RimL family protein N-acetyltransferase
VGNEASRRLLRRLGFVEEPDDPPWVLAVRDPARPASALRVTGRHVC